MVGFRETNRERKGHAAAVVDSANRRNEFMVPAMEDEVRLGHREISSVVGVLWYPLQCVPRVVQHRMIKCDAFTVCSYVLAYKTFR